MRWHARIMSAAVAVSCLAFSPTVALAAVSAGNSVIHEGTAREINNMYELDGIEYWVYEDANCSTRAKDTSGNLAVLTVTYDKNSNTAKTNMLELEPKKYYVKENPASVEGTGLTVDTTVYEANVTSDHTETNPFTLTSTEDVVCTWSGSIVKLDKHFGQTPSGDGSLEGAVIRVDYYDENNSARDAAWYKANRNATKPHSTWFFTTNADGEIDLDTAATTSFGGTTSSPFKMANGKRVFLLGTYVMEEVKAPTGYNLSDNLAIARLTQASVNTTTPAGKLEFTAEDEPTPEPIKIEKRDAEPANGQVAAEVDADAAAHTRFLESNLTPENTLIQGDTDHGSTYRVQNISGHAIWYKKVSGDFVEVGQNEYLPDEFTAEASSSDENAKWVTPQIEVPYGTYRITEIRPGMGMMLDESWTQEVVAHHDEAHKNDVYEFTQLNVPIRGGLGLVKVDSGITERGWSISGGHKLDTILTDVINGQGDAKLVGAEFTVKNVSAHPVLVDGKWYAKDADICVLTTYQNDEGQVVASMPSNVSLPYGTYEVRETKAPEGYRDMDGLIGGEALVLHPETDENGSWYFVGWIR